MAHVLSNATGFPIQNTKIYTGYHQDILYTPKIIDLMFRNNILKTHVRCSEFNRKIIEQTGMKVIVLTRNIFDVIPSIVDHIKKNKCKGPLFAEKIDCDSFERATLVDYVIDVYVPWYFSFYVSWYKEKEEGKKIQLLWLDYEDVTIHLEDKYNEIMTFLNLSEYEKDSTKISNLLNGNKKNFNKGIVGRGTTLTENQKQKISSFCKYYPDVDFSPIGIDGQ